MALLQLKSNNPRFGYAIRKNPASGMILREMRQGTAYGWYSDAQTFNVYFRDSDQVSYPSRGGNDSEYLNVSQYNAPGFVLNTLSEFFGHLISRDDDEDKGEHEHLLSINRIYLPLKYLEILRKHLPEFAIEGEEVALKNFRITIKHTGTLRRLLSFANLLALLGAVKFAHEELDKNAVGKYIKCLEVVEAPYFVRYVLKVNCLRSKPIFNLYKEALERSSKEKIELQFGTTSIMRERAVAERLDFKNPIIDIGCGEGDYVVRFGKKLGDRPYYAVEPNDERRAIAEKRAKKEGLKNVRFSPTFDFDLPSDAKVDVLLVEVIEHLEPSDAVTLIRRILEKAGTHLNKLIITTPNRAFNKNYFHDDGEMRHEDHRFELDKQEFGLLVQKAIVGSGAVIGDEFGIGDMVDGESVTLSVAVIK